MILCVSVFFSVLAQAARFRGTAQFFHQYDNSLTPDREEGKQRSRFYIRQLPSKRTAGKVAEGARRNKRDSLFTKKLDEQEKINSDSKGLSSCVVAAAALFSFS